ncbi:unnamed protein product [Closterium sp. NIES-65]|nr:unnamed protein product [Closterium sp. NIES-65]
MTDFDQDLRFLTAFTEGFRAFPWTESGFLVKDHLKQDLHVPVPSHSHSSGFSAFPWTGISILVKDHLKLGPAAAQLMTSTAYMPWSVKPLYGILSYVRL